MAFKVIIFAAVVAVAQAGYLAAPAVSHYAAAPALHRPLAYAAPAVSHYAAPAIHRPLAYAAPVARAYAAPVAHYAAAPAIAKVAVPAEYDANPQYSYAYSVADALTGDNKHQEETRNGDVVQGSYSLLESDGTTRTVEYTADPVNGFNAVVHKTGTPVVQKAVVAAPAYAKIASPVHYAAPVAKFAAPLHYGKIATPLAYHG